VEWDNRGDLRREKERIEKKLVEEQVKVDRREDENIQGGRSSGGVEGKGRSRDFGRKQSVLRGG
jgi:hypothetical protein